MSKKIICGEIDGEYNGTPIEIFELAVELSKLDNFEVHTNNPQFVEALEVLCGEDNIDFYIFINGECVLQDTVTTIYNYLGDVYNILNSLRFIQDLDDEITPEIINDEISEYKLKHQYLAEESNPIVEENFKEYVEILPEPKHIQAYQTDKPVVFRSAFGKVIAQAGDWIIKYPDGRLHKSSTIGQYKEVEDE